MCDRVELSLHIWLENSFSVESGLSGLCGETIVCEDGMLHSLSLCLLTSMSDCFRCSFLSRDGRSKKTFCWKSVVSLFALCPKNKRHRNMNCSTRCLWKWRDSWCVQRERIISEPPQCQLLRNQEKRLLLLARHKSHFSCSSKGIRTCFNGPRGWTVFSAQIRTINETLHLS